MTNAFEVMLNKMTIGRGFVAALDQSGGSSPKALKEYGVPEDAYEKDETSMFDVIHEMRSRIITSPAFDDRVLGVILFEDTMERQIKGKPTSDYLWEEKGIVPFLKIDKGLEKEENGVQLMKPIPNLDELLKRAKDKYHIFGTKMRSVIHSANTEGIKAIVNQQFELGKKILEAGLIPILEPEVDIHSKDKMECEIILKENILDQLNRLVPPDQVIILKLTLPHQDNFYKECLDHPRCIRVVALSGGYPREEAIKILAKQDGVIASFSRALLESLHHDMSEDEFNKELDTTIEGIYKASTDTEVK